MEPFSQYAVAAAGEAIAQAGLDMEKEDRSAWEPASVPVSEAYRRWNVSTKKCWKKDEPREPAARSDDDQQHGSRQCGNALWFKGKSINVVTACATGTNSIGEAFRSIQYGEADVMVAGGTESAITPLGMAGFAALTALSTNDDRRRHPVRLIRTAMVSSWARALVS